MKKGLSLIMVLTIMLSLAACGNEKEATHQTETVLTTGAPEMSTYSFGNSVTTDLFKFTPTFEGFEQEVGNWPDENYMKPNGKISGSNPFKGDDEKTLMCFSAVVEYVGKSKKAEEFKFNCSVDYDNGYIFDFDPYFYGITRNIKSGDWSYDTSVTFEPLSEHKTAYIRFIIKVPKQVKSGTDKPVTVRFNVGDNEYVYKLR